LWQRSVSEDGLKLITKSEQEDDGLCFQPPRDERQHFLAGPIEPMRVVHDDEQRGARGDIGEQLQRGKRHQEEIGRRRASAHAEGGQESVTLRIGQAGQVSDLGQVRPEELMQTRERQVRF
jgi:hypothetical protein